MITSPRWAHWFWPYRCWLRIGPPLHHVRGIEPMVQVSVIVPAYKPSGFHTLRTSITANADADAEWIVVDDGSGAKFDVIFAELEGTGARIIRKAKNCGQASARNLGLDQSRGKWVKFLDADDSLDKGHLTALVTAVQAAPKKAIPFAPTQHIFANGQISTNDSWGGLPADPNAQLLRQLVRPFLHHCGALFQRSLLEHLGGYDENLITDEDGDLLLRILYAGYYFIPVESVNYLYIHHANGFRVSSDDSIAKMLARILTCEKVLNRYDDGVPSNVANAVAQRMDKIALIYWSTFPAEARALIARAERLSPGYSPDMNGPLRNLRRIGGPSRVFAAQRLYRGLRGRPKGGTQG